MRRPLIGGEDFEASMGQGEQARRKVMEAYQGRESLLGWKKGVVHDKDVCKTEAWKDFHDKASRVLFQIVVPPKSTIGFVSNLKQYLFRKCRRFSPNFNIMVWL
jgi:hypothetical protein